MLRILIITIFLSPLCAIARQNPFYTPEEIPDRDSLERNHNHLASVYGFAGSYDIVKAHGGEIRVQSKEGEGTEFNFQLPLA
jgi:signal transduction histidine kinase